MHAPRWRTTLTPLADGSVLAAGGDPNDVTSEIFAAGAWAMAGDMNAGRSQPVAAALDNGNCALLVGGWPAVFSAEVFVAATGAWTTTAPLSEAQKWGETVTTLVDGRVLVVGGDSATSAEVYNPHPSDACDATAGAWQSIAEPFANVSGHTATRLADGRVLFAGGGLGSVPLTGAYLFDAATDTFTQAATMGLPRMYHSATRLPNGDVMLIGGSINGVSEAHASTTIYLPASDAWIDGPPLPEARRWHEGLLIDGGYVLLVGGFIDNQASARTELFDVSAGLWRELPDLASPRFRAAAAVIAGTSGAADRVLVAGGAQDTPYAEQFQRVDLGGDCTLDAECVSGHCVDQLCCDRVCDACHSCLASISGGSDGVCTPVPDETPCGEGRGICASGNCSEDEPVCASDGVTLQTPGAPDSSCHPYRCREAACTKPCSSSLDCVSGYVCDESQACVPRRDELVVTACSCDAPGQLATDRPSHGHEEQQAEPPSSRTLCRG